jgi:2-keto-4-pentenoate hydratase/2-oxohepta-3-ene-1,7-dioic acid hydratase in catechol pathway
VAASPDTVTWLGRAIVDEHGERPMQVVTSGRPPAPGDLAEEIRDPFAAPAPDDAAVEVVPGGLRAEVRSLRLAPPVRPSKILAVGRNFHAHAAELGNEVPKEPLLFFKPPSCLVGDGAAVELPRGFERIDMESELVVVIGRRGRAVPANDAWRHVAGITLGNDVSCRDLQRRDDQWARAKGYDGFGPVGPWIRVTPAGVPFPLERMRLTGTLNGEVRQDSSLGLMIFDPAAIIACASAVMTLEPGDLIFMGTPQGVSALTPGDTVATELTGEWPLGRLTTPFT